MKKEQSKTTFFSGFFAFFFSFEMNSGIEESARLKSLELEMCCSYFFPE